MVSHAAAVTAFPVGSIVASISALSSGTRSTNVHPSTRFRVLHNNIGLRGSSELFQRYEARVISVS